MESPMQFCKGVSETPARKLHSEANTEYIEKSWAHPYYI
jgi:hypothetical protein